MSRLRRPLFRNVGGTGLVEEVEGWRTRASRREQRRNQVDRVVLEEIRRVLALTPFGQNLREAPLSPCEG